jgi:hypothetical protein
MAYILRDPDKGTALLVSGDLIALPDSNATVLFPIVVIGCLTAIPAIPVGLA